MGTVYEAVQVSLDRTVALKVLADELVRDDAFIDKFIKDGPGFEQTNRTVSLAIKSGLAQAVHRSDSSEMGIFTPVIICSLLREVADESAATAWRVADTFATTRQASG